MSRMPSVKRLEEAFPGKGKELRDLLKMKTQTTDYKSVRDWEDQCLNRPRYSERLMCALNEILEGYGTEPIWGVGEEMWPVAEYVNMDDTYNTTLLYDYGTGTIQITSMGAWVEHNEKRIRQ